MRLLSAIRAGAFVASFLGAGGGLAAGAPPSRPLRAGFAKRVITPSLGRNPVYLAGFGHDRRATGVHDDLFVRCMAVADGSTRVALCALDVIGFFLPDTERARGLLAGLVPGARLVVASTHNHEGPDTMGLWGPGPATTGVDPAYQERLRHEVAATAAAALAALTPAQLTFAHARTPGLVADRREPQVLDDEVRIGRALALDGRPLGSFVVWGSHPEALGERNTLITADYPHYLVSRVEAALSGICVFWSGAIGGLMTPLSVGLKDEAGREVPLETFAHAQAVGHRGAEAALHALERATPSKSTALEHRVRRVRVPLSNPLFRLGLALGVLERPLFTRGQRDTATSPALFRGLPVPLARGEDIETEIGYLLLGDAELLLVPGEIYPELVKGGLQDPQDAGADYLGAAREPALLDLLTAEHRMVIGLANDAIGYIIPRSQWDERPPFAYGRSEAQYGEVNSVGDRVAPLLADAFRALVRPRP